ncbi:alginate export family protein [Novosphingobium guangzhouense]|uniref:alginate export family protein n=1 Tax=Novosphingobium guangzhouense TaxID=1850347 RepID=UPI001FEC54F9|nr:alginate export family protein [Novosphingobium guangzhouense]
MTPNVRSEATLSKRLGWFAVYRAICLASGEDGFSPTGVRDASEPSGNFVRHQSEANVRYWVVPQRLRFEFDGLILAKGRFLRDAPMRRSDDGRAMPLSI